MSQLSKRFKNLRLVKEMLRRGFESFGLLNLSMTNTVLKGYLTISDMGEVLANIENGEDITRCAT